MAILMFLVKNGAQPGFLEEVYMVFLKNGVWQNECKFGICTPFITEVLIFHLNLNPPEGRKILPK